VPFFARLGGETVDHFGTVAKAMQIIESNLALVKHAETWGGWKELATSEDAGKVAEKNKLSQHEQNPAA
jgi:hypothetical protein